MSTSLYIFRLLMDTKDLKIRNPHKKKFEFYSLILRVLFNRLIEIYILKKWFNNNLRLTAINTECTMYKKFTINK